MFMFVGNNSLLPRAGQKGWVLVTSSHKVILGKRILRSPVGLGVRIGWCMDPRADLCFFRSHRGNDYMVNVFQGSGMLTNS